MIRLSLVATVLASLLSVAAARAEDATARGEYLARAGDCVACHSVPGGKAFAGGLKMATPVGTIATTNITPDPETGIGRYTLDDFDRALRRGVARDGHHLYPAMPYPSYAVMADDDVRALYDYFMHAVPPVRQANLPSDISVLIIEHDMKLVFRFAERISVLVQGRVLTEGTPAEIAANPVVRDVYLGTRHHG